MPIIGGFSRYGQVLSSMGRLSAAYVDSLAIVEGYGDGWAIDAVAPSERSNGPNGRYRISV